jgi:hypothetical protein
MPVGTTIAGLASGLATKLITSGIQRVGSLTFQKAMRISKIEQTLRGQVQRNPNVKAAMNDFETLIGTRFGEYTEQLAKFLEELERGGLITAMVEDALLERNSLEVQASFGSLFGRAFPTGPNEAHDLYEKLAISFRISFRELSQDKVTADILKLVHRDISSRLDRVTGLTFIGNVLF